MVWGVGWCGVPNARLTSGSASSSRHHFQAAQRFLSFSFVESVVLDGVGGSHELTSVCCCVDVMHIDGGWFGRPVLRGGPDTRRVCVPHVLPAVLARHGPQQVRASVVGIVMTEKHLLGSF